ncbi:MAG: hypothetical protein GTN86_01945 [Xanthomonadales bacterium]|nr:hypothetical protein [Xanthomonadales bacterium]NIN58778.1 hypothetical protein [Xanthomonadales bacterium]NIN74046.1 hypothetical protein [Xanthomonadales bacterium]NIO13796.1 hypothetical protein [Xanthomonadales bacterium]NIP11171.1 hypothetical protein [Xanthomonadales bacterium]
MPPRTPPKLLALVLAVTLSLSAHGAELVREFKGSRSMTTAEFEVAAPWILEWRVTGDFPMHLAVDVALLYAGTGVHVGNVLKTKQTGNGVKLFEQGGRFTFLVNASMASWTLRVEQLTRQEAAQYTPKTEP